MTQTLAVGKPAASKYAELGGFTGNMISPPSRMRAFVFGFPNEGKSVLLQTNPDAFIFNFDESSTVTPQVKATLFPGKDADGSPIGDGGARVVADWDLYEPKIAILKRLAAENKPRPTTVAFDSLTSWIRLLKFWVTKNAKKVGIVSKSDERSTFEWKDLDGRAAWDWIYDKIVQTIVELSNCGYGVWVIGHVANERVPMGDNLYVKKPELTITDNFWKRLHDLMEFVAVVYKEDADITVEEPTETRLPDGRVIKGVRKSVKKTTRHYLAIDKLEFQGIIKNRVPFPPKIELSKEGAWADFDKAYRDAMSRAVVTTPITPVA